MDRNEKKRLREHIGEHIEVSGARLTDDDATLLGNFIDKYDETYKGRTKTSTTSHTSWSSDGKFTRTETVTDTFTDDFSIRRDHEYRDDDGQTGASTTEIKDARGILNWFKERQ